MKKVIITLIVLGVIAGSVGAYYRYRTPEEGVKISKLAVARGDVIESVGATGTLQAVKTVQVGSQVSGNIKALYADFNTIVKKGQIVAELDPSLIQTQIEQARANVIRSQADLDRLKVSLEDARIKLKRTESLAARKLVSPQELETAQVAVRDITTGQTTRLVRGGSPAEYVAPGYLVYAVAGTLRAVRVDPDTLAVGSDPVPVVEAVRTSGTGAAEFSVSRTGALVYVPDGAEAAAQRSLVWVTRDGREEPLTAAPPRAYSVPRLSPDGTCIHKKYFNCSYQFWN